MGSPSNWRMALEFQVFYFFKGILLKSVVLRILIGGWNKFGDAPKSMLLWWRMLMIRWLRYFSGIFKECFFVIIVVGSVLMRF